MVASANFTVNGNAVPPAIAVSGGASVTLALTNISGVRTVAWSIVGNSSPALTNPTITPGGSPLGATATFTMPAGTDQAYLIQCLVNGGKDDEGVVQSSLTKRAIVGVVNSAGVVPFCNGEVFERDAIYGWVTALNVIGDSVTSGTGAISDNAVTFAKIQDIGVGLIGNDTGTADPKLITLGSGLAFAAGAIVASAVALTSLANIAAHSFLGNNTGSAAAPIALTATQLTAELTPFVASGASHAKGLVPDPGSTSGTSHYLREDGTWAIPSGTFTNPSTPGDDNKLAYANAGAIGWRAGVTSPNANQLAFAAELTNSNLRIEHNTALLSARDSGNTTYNQIAFWGAAADVLQFGTAPGGVDKVAEIRHKATLTTFQVAGVTALSIAASALTFAGAVATGTVAPVFKITDAAHTALTASTERNSVLFDLGQTRQWATGALTTQRSLRVLAPTLSFVGASTVTTAATVAISAAPIAGTNATITNSLALWIEAGAIGYGATPAQSGSARYTSNTFAKWRNGAGTPNTVDLNGFGYDSTDSAFVGDNTNGVALYLDTKSGGVTRIRSGAQVWAFNDTQLDCASKSIVNLLALNGVRVTVGVLGAAIADTNGQTVSVSGGTLYEQTTPFTANRSVAIAITGATTKEIIAFKRHVADGFTLTITDEVGNPLYTFPANEKRAAEFQYNTAVANKFANVSHTRIA